MPRLPPVLMLASLSLSLAWSPSTTGPSSSSTLVQSSSATLTPERVLSYPFPEHLVASPAGATVAWVFNERGVRNLYAADAPDFRARRLTPYTDDDGQELTGLAFSHDGRTIVYVRGGDHGANWPAEGNLMPDPASSPIRQKMEIWAVPVAGGTPKLLGEGDHPAVAPRAGRVAFVKDRQIWIAPLDGSKPAELAFFAKGSIDAPAWSPDGATLAFVSNRSDHSFIGFFSGTNQPIRYLAPSTSRDSSPRWSPDGKSIAFVRQPGRGGMPRSPLEPQPSPWALWVGDPADLTARQVWHSGSTLVDSFPTVQGGANLNWGAAGKLIFLSYQDGWPHLYSVPAGDGQALLLTPGRFMVEFVALSPDRRFIVYNANTGPDSHDIDRRHLFKVPVDAPAPQALTSGAGIEWSPVSTADGKYVAYLASDAQRPPLPAVIPSAGGAPIVLARDRLPAGYPSSSLVSPEPIVVRSEDGLDIHCQLFKPPQAVGKHPALVYVHGGPPRQMLLGWHYMYYYANDYAANQLLASQGFLVLSVNYRLGIGYGHAFHHPEHAGARGAAEYRDVIAAGRYLQSRSDVDAKRIGIWGGSYGGYLTALALGRSSDVFAAGVDLHGVHDWARQGRPQSDRFQLDLRSAALAGDGITEADLQRAGKVVFESSPISAVPTWRSPVLLIHADDDRNVDFSQTVDLGVRLKAKGVKVEELVIPDDIHDFLLWRTWRTVVAAVGDYFSRMLLGAASPSP